MFGTASSRYLVAFACAGLVAGCGESGKSSAMNPPEETTDASSPRTGGAGGGGSGGSAVSNGGAGGAATGGAGGGSVVDAGATPADAAAGDRAVMGDLPAPSGELTATCTGMIEGANKFLAGLTAAQRQQAVQPFAGPNRTNWEYLPPTSEARMGLPLKNASDATKALALAFMKTGLSEGGYVKATVIIALERVLGRTPDDYYVTVFGTPSATENWGWRVEGHHLSLNFTVVRCAVIANTPAFWGANPARVDRMVTGGPPVGTRPLKDEEDFARQLAAALTAAQRTKATIMMPNMTTLQTPRIQPFAAAGIPAAELMPAQVDLLKKVVGAYLGSMAPALAAKRLAEIEAAGFDKVAFGWAGGNNPMQGAYYYRVQGPTFVIEHDNTQGGGGHIHSVWRDFRGDFGGDFGPDLLRAHYEDVPH